MNTLFEHPNSDRLLTSPALVDLAIRAWLDAKYKRTTSTKTSKAYRDTLLDFRTMLISQGLDLDGDPRAIALLAQAWSGASKRAGHTVRRATINQRLAIVSSFYEYAARADLLPDKNPIAKVERPSVQKYAGALPMDIADLKQKMGAIDRTTVHGKRDYALLAVALETGRRATELVSLTRGDLTLSSGRLLVTFKHCKGNREMADTLTSRTSKAVIAYLYAAYGPDFMALPFSAPLWVSFSNCNKGQTISIQTIADICQRRLGISKVHALRHTFAHTMQKAGATVSDIQARLGHESLETTGRYLAALNRADNPFADQIADLFGF